MRSLLPPRTRRVLSRHDVVTTAAWIAENQRSDGLIAWTPGGVADPWNHVEAAMALDVVGRHGDARRAYDHLLARQRDDGSFPVDLADDSERRVDTNTVAYAAAGLFHHAVATGDGRYATRVFPAVERALEFVVGCQLPGGAVAWNVDADGVTATHALVAGSSSVLLSLRCGARLASLVGLERPAWQARAGEIAVAVRDRTSPFFDKSEFAMDWYYPVLAGAIVGGAATEHLAAGGSGFVTADGVRCRSDGRWVTTAESAEVAIARAVCGDIVGAAATLATVADKRQPSGAYLTGLVYPERSQFPPGEATTYSAAAVLLAADLLVGGRPTAAVFASTRRSTRRLPVALETSSTNAPEPIASR
jgi:hypothetical protein